MNDKSVSMTGSPDALADGRQEPQESNYDPSPTAFRETHPQDRFTGSTGVLFEQAMAQTRMSVCLCDPHAADNPIVFANRAFRHLTGYEEEEILGRNCRFLQGPETDPRQIDRIRKAIAKQDVVVVEMLNYRKDGSSFWNALHMGPIYNEAGELIYFFGSQWNVSELRAARMEEILSREMARELSHRMKNMFSVISGIVNITGRMRGVETEAREINDRVQALARAYETTLDSAATGYIQVAPAIRAILQPYGVDESRLQLLGNGLRVPFTIVSSISLALHELAANATKHGAWSVDGGAVAVDWYEANVEGKPQLVVEWRESGLENILAPEGAGGSGNAIIDRMIRYGGGETVREWHSDGLHVKIICPIGTAPE